MYTNKKVFLLISVITFSCFASPANNPFDEKNKIKHGINELWKRCRENPELCASLTLLLQIDGKNSVEDWSSLSQKFSDIIAAARIDQGIFQELGFPLRELFSQIDCKGIQWAVGAQENLFDNQTRTLQVTLAHDSEYDKRAWAHITALASTLAIEGSGEGLSPETIRKLGPVAKQVLEAHTEKGNHSALGLGASDEQGNTIFSYLFPKKGNPQGK